MHQVYTARNNPLEIEGQVLFFSDTIARCCICCIGLVRTFKICVLNVDKCCENFFFSNAVYMGFILQSEYTTVVQCRISAFKNTLIIDI